MCCAEASDEISRMIQSQDEMQTDLGKEVSLLMREAR
jgi:hypothetical protein